MNQDQTLIPPSVLRDLAMNREALGLALDAIRERLRDEPGSSLAIEGLGLAADMVRAKPAIRTPGGGGGVSCPHCGSDDMHATSWVPEQYGISESGVPSGECEHGAIWLNYRSACHDASGETHLYCNQCTRLATLDGIEHDYM